MDTDSETQQSETAATSTAPASTTKTTSRATLARVLPTDRISFESQVSVLRGFAATSGTEKKAVTADEVAKTMANIVGSSVALCHSFFADVGFLIPEGRKYRPSDEVFDFARASQWDKETAGLKLASALGQSWSAKFLRPRLAYSTMAKDQVIKALADEAKAGTTHRRSLETLLEFLVFSGIVAIDARGVSLGSVASEAAENGSNKQQLEDESPQGASAEGVDVSGVKPSASSSPFRDSDDHVRFEVPIPEQASAVIYVPTGLEVEDWEMIKTMMDSYISRLIKKKKG